MVRLRSAQRAPLAIPVALLLHGPLAAQCFEWSDTFASPLAGPDRPVMALAALDLGDGPALYAGGAFEHAGPTPAVSVARFDGSSWFAVGTGLSGTTQALASFDSGSGPALYAGGYLTIGGIARPFARLDGGVWTAVTGLAGSGLVNVQTLLAFDDDGLGDDLYVGGIFESAGGFASGCIARWDGSAWSSVGGGVTDPEFAIVMALRAFDGGLGPALYAAGQFTAAGGVPASSLARWDGSAWSSVGGLDGDVRALAVFDDGSGPALYCGGRFNTAGGVAARNLARFDGAAWSGIGFAAPSEFPFVDDLLVFDDGSGPALFVTGSFVHAGGRLAHSIARYDAAGWATLQDGLVGSGIAMAAFDDGAGSALYVGGQINQAGPVELANVARWNGAQWSDLGDAPGQGLILQHAPVNALAVFDAGAGARLYAGGSFRVANSPAGSLASFDGATWQGTALDEQATVEALLVHDDGGGPALFVGGAFSAPGAEDIARFDGASFAPLGLGLFGGNVSVDALASFDDGGGPALYATGEFTQAGGAPASRIARWDGAGWTALGAGLDLRGHALCTFDDGGGPALYAGGAFTQAGGSLARRVARWDGTSWSPLGSGLGGLGITRCEALAVFDDGSGPALFVGGRFGSAGGVPSKGVARWDGTSWSSPGGGMAGFLNKVEVEALFVFDDGTGAALYAGGQDLGAPSDQLQRFDGVSWQGLGSLTFQSGSLSSVHALAAFDARAGTRAGTRDGTGAGAALVAGGFFDEADGDSSWSLALRVRLAGPSCPNDTGLPYCFGDGSGSACPCANAGARGHGCASAQVADGARLEGSGDPAANAVVMHAASLPASTTAILIRSASASSPPEGVAFGDGLLCLGAPIVRLGAVVAAGGLADWTLDHQAGAGTFRYQAWYRNNPATFCAPERFNLSNGFQVVFP